MEVFHRRNKACPDPVQIIRNILELRAMTNEWRRENLSIGFVPTMGNLHAGHLQLVEESRVRADRTVVSIFVNPMQFGETEDFDGYPKTTDEDCAALTEKEVDVVFMPEVEEIYPGGLQQTTRIEVTSLSDIVEGSFRPGHFQGVATVVAKLLNMVQPDVASFGEKDFQQLLVIRQMVQDLNMPVQIIGIPTVREPDGLAMSSRNGYLTDEERKLAPEIYRTLQNVQGQLNQGGRDFQILEQQAEKDLNKKGFKTDYLMIRRAEDLLYPTADDHKLVILVASWLGKARLIDSLPINLSV